MATQVLRHHGALDLAVIWKIVINALQILSRALFLVILSTLPRD